jgi:hypothetical protein
MSSGNIVIGSLVFLLVILIILVVFIRLNWPKFLTKYFRPACPAQILCDECPPTKECPHTDCNGAYKIWRSTDTQLTEKTLNNKVKIEAKFPFTGKIIGLDVFASGLLSSGRVLAKFNVENKEVWRFDKPDGYKDVSRKHFKLDDIPVKREDTLYFEWSTAQEDGTLKAIVDSNNVPFVQIYYTEESS